MFFWNARCQIQLHLGTSYLFYFAFLISDVWNIWERWSSVVIDQSHEPKEFISSLYNCNGFRTHYSAPKCVFRIISVEVCTLNSLWSL